MNDRIIEESRLDRGYRKLLEIDGNAGEEVKDSLNDFAPDLVRYMLEYSFGDIYSREGLDVRSKEIAVVAALTAIGNAMPQLKVHINAALNVGCTISDVKEVILQMSSYSGFPSSINAMNVLKEVVANRVNQGIVDVNGSVPSECIDPMKRYEEGSKNLSMLDSDQVRILEEAYIDFSPELVQYVVHSYADIISRDNLCKRDRQIATIAALTALGTAAPQLQFHIKAGLNVGLTIDEVKEIMLLMTVYVGFPAAINGMNILKEVAMKSFGKNA